MATVNLSPILNGYQSFLPTGLPNNSGFINTYQAGTTTPLATYTTSAGNVQNANPIALNASGYPPQEIWLVAGSAYKFTITDLALNIISTFDNITGSNDIATLIQNQTVNTATTAGTSTAYTATPSQPLTQYVVGQAIDTTFNSTCGLNPTININGLGAINLVKELADSTYVNLNANDVVVNHTSRVRIISGPLALVERVTQDRHPNLFIPTSVVNTPANGWTVGLSSPANTAFRNSSLTLGTSNIINLAAAISIVVPSGATLGSSNGVLARFYGLVINPSAGVIEFAIVNAAGGVYLGEDNLI